MCFCLCFLLVCSQKLQVFQEVNFSCLEGRICHCLGVHESRETHQNRRMKSVNLAFRIFAHGKQACFGLSRLSFAAAKTETEKSQRIRQVTKGRRMPKAEGATQFNREVPSNASNASHRLSFNISAPGLIALMLFLSIMTSHCKTLNKTPKMQENSLEIQQKHKLLRASDLWNHGTG